MSNLQQATRILYRELLKAAHELDKNPIGKLFLIAQPKAVYSREKASKIKLKKPPSHLNTLLRKFNSGGEFYAPSNNVVEALRDQFRKKANVDENEALSFGFQVLRRLNFARTCGSSLIKDSICTSSKDVFKGPNFLELTSGYTVGSLLITHPVSCINQPILHGAVSIICEDNDIGVDGLILNKPLDTKLLKVLENGDSETLMKFKPFWENRLFLGGIVHSDITMLHSVELPNSKCILPGLYYSTNYDAALEMVKKGEATADQFKLFFGKLCWEKSQLDFELQRNVWFCAQNSSSVPMIEGVGNVALQELNEDISSEDVNVYQRRIWAASLRQLGHNQDNNEYTAFTLADDRSKMLKLLENFLEDHYNEIESSLEDAVK